MVATRGPADLATAHNVLAQVTERVNHLREELPTTRTTVGTGAPPKRSPPRRAGRRDLHGDVGSGAES
ncbi:hypothetical protein AB0M95_20255 [Sphaerisporangium sp. NPDC051017]|uniref:hypothetical protein n=1 Tax=Sphaerisporangium sp. NPDC051017 TaxID=3154636 RepID=UPI0034412751